MRIVTAYRAFDPEGDMHRTLGRFDWVGAIEMLRDSAKRSAGLDVHVLTDKETVLSGPAFRYRSNEDRLMLWILDVWAQYLASPDFDTDSIMLSPDTLVLDDIKRYVQPADLGIVLRTNEKFAKVMPLLNGVQFWRYRGRQALAAFFREVHTRATRMPETLIQWGADTQAIVEMLPHLHVGFSQCGPLKVYAYEATALVRPLRAVDVRRMEMGLEPKATTEPLIDFRSFRKVHMANYYREIFGTRQIA